MSTPDVSVIEVPLPKPGSASIKYSAKVMLPGADEDDGYAGSSFTV
jgi:hypothetical protein